ncbi:MAG: archease [Thermoplasmata archaeon]
MHQIIEHTADIGLIAKADTFAHTLDELAVAMFDLILDIKAVEPKYKIDISINYDNIDALVVDFLSELIYQFDANHFVPCNVKTTLQKTELKAELTGEKYDRKKHGSKLEIKAVTYHMLNVDLVNNEIKILFDI